MHIVPLYIPVHKVGHDWQSNSRSELLYLAIGGRISNAEGKQHLHSLLCNVFPSLGSAKIRSSLRCNVMVFQTQNEYPGTKYFAYSKYFAGELSESDSEFSNKQPS